MNIEHKTSSIYNYFEDANKNVGGEYLFLKDGCQISLLCNAVANMFHVYDQKVKDGDEGGKARNLEIRDHLLSLWNEISNISRKHDARIEKEMKKLLEKDKKLIKKSKVA